MRIKDFAKLTGVSIRTLHYYDEIGLLKPSYVNEHNNYRFYDSESLERIQEIMFYRELDFSLKSISEIISSQNYSKQKVIKEQKHLLILKKQRLEKIISALESLEKGEKQMNTNVFDNREFEKATNDFKAEIKNKWGSTSAYSEYESKSKNYSKETWNNIHLKFDEIFGEFADCLNKGLQPSYNTVQALVGKLQEYITVHFYKCTNDILSGLGEMYVNDERFKNNINKHGNGIAEFVSSAIKIYCKS